MKHPVIISDVFKIRHRSLEHQSNGIITEPLLGYSQLFLFGVRLCCCPAPLHRQSRCQCPQKKSN